MTDSTGKKITWLEWRSQQTGKSVEELRGEMRERGAKADKSKSGFAQVDKDKLREYAAQARAKKAEKHGKG